MADKKKPSRLPSILLGMSGCLALCLAVTIVGVIFLWKQIRRLVLC